MSTTSPMRYPLRPAGTERSSFETPRPALPAAPGNADQRLRAQVLERLSQTSLRHLGRPARRSPPPLATPTSACARRCWSV